MSKKKIVMLVLTVLVMSVLSANSQPTISVSGTVKLICSNCNIFPNPMIPNPQQPMIITLKTANDQIVGQKVVMFHIYTLTKPNVVHDEIPYQTGTVPVKATIYVDQKQYTEYVIENQLKINIGSHICSVIVRPIVTPSLN